MLPAQATIRFPVYVTDQDAEFPDIQKTLRQFGIKAKYEETGLNAEEHYTAVFYLRKDAETRRWIKMYTKLHDELEDAK